MEGTIQSFLLPTINAVFWVSEEYGEEIRSSEEKQQIYNEKFKYFHSLSLLIYNSPSALWLLTLAGRESRREMILEQRM